MQKPHWKRKICLTLGLVQGRNCCVDKDSGVAVMVWFPGVFSLLWAFLSLVFALFSLIFPFFLVLFSSRYFLVHNTSLWFFWVLIFSLFFFPFLPFSSNSYYGSLLSAQTLLFFSLFLTWYFLSKLAHIVSCFTPLFMSNDEAFRTFLGGMFVAISSFGSISILHHNFGQTWLCCPLCTSFAVISKDQNMIFFNYRECSTHAREGNNVLFGLFYKCGKEKKKVKVEPKLWKK